MPLIIDSDIDVWAMSLNFMADKIIVELFTLMNKHILYGNHSQPCANLVAGQ
jgi:hypothetical protein